MTRHIAEGNVAATMESLTKDSGKYTVVNNHTRYYNGATFQIGIKI